MNPTALSLDQYLACIPFLDDTEQAGLKDELPTYLSKVTDLDNAYDPLEWWKTNASALPCWSLAAQKIVLVPKESFHYLNLVLEINRTTLLRIM